MSDVTYQNPAARGLVAEVAGLAGSGETWSLWNSGRGDPAFNMALDEASLEAAPALGQPLLRFYGWIVPAASFGYSQRYTEAERLTRLRPLIRRPTGGGVVPHDRDWTYSLSFPPGHGWYALRARDSYQRLHVWLQHSFQRLGVDARLAPTAARGAPTHCFVRTEQFDVLWEGAKIAGAAQRRTRSGLLIQGSVQPPAGADRRLWERALLDLAAANWGVHWSSFEPDARWLEGAAQLARQKYALDPYNRRR